MYSFWILTLVVTSQAFFPYDWREKYFGKNGMTHETQTVIAYDVLAEKYFPQYNPLTSSMLKAREALVEANAEVDEDQTHSANHFDGESIGPGMARLVDFKLAVVDALNQFDGITARHILGQALHTLQDFYAHTNWVELGNTQINPLLGHERTQPHAFFSETTCVNCGNDLYGQCKDCRQNMATDKLTSGYYYGEDSPSPGVDIPDYKCHHGGVLDNPHGFLYNVAISDVTPGINKDSGNCFWSPHHHLHETAADLSVRATIKYIEDVISLLNDRSKVRLLFGAGPTIAFAIDTTGSMQWIMKGVKQKVIDLAKGQVGTRDEASTYIVAPFNDPTTGPVTRTSDINAFVAQVNALEADGGQPPCAELAMTGILDALTFMEGGGNLFVMTDADARDSDLISQVIYTAKKKNVKIHLFRFSSDCGDPVTKRALPTYQEVARQTGGSYQYMRDSEVFRMDLMWENIFQNDQAPILKIEGGPVGWMGKSFNVPVDSQMSKLVVHVKTNLAWYKIYKPDGTEYDYYTSPGANYTRFDDGRFITIKSPVVGVWSVMMGGNGDYVLDVYGISSLHFTSFNFVALSGRPGHEGYAPIKTEPAYDHQVAAVAVVDGALSSVKFDLRRSEGDAAVNLTMRASTEDNGRPGANSFYGETQLSAGRFFAYASGVDSNGAAFQRVITSPFTPILSGETYTGFNNTNPFEVPNNSTSTTSSTTLTPTTTTTTSTTTTTTTPSTTSTTTTTTSTKTTTKTSTTTSKTTTKTTTTTTTKKTTTTTTKPRTTTTTTTTKKTTTRTTTRPRTTTSGYPHTCKIGVVYTHSEYMTGTGKTETIGPSPTTIKTTTSVSKTSTPVKITTRRV